MGDLVKATRSLANAIRSLEDAGHFGIAAKLKPILAGIESHLNN